VTKCEKYWADEGEKMFGDISVTTVRTKKLRDLDIRYYKVKRFENEQDVIHYHFLGWPDFGNPTDPNKLLQVIDKVRKSPNISPLRPIVAHCSGGIGRTGTFLLMFNMIDMADKSDTVDVYKQFVKLRTQRVDVVALLDQYKFVYKTLLTAINNKM
ncbi:receptor-type tyrosine-protein phosphatase kappa-like protein, partial [Leptotrombidium deliense]